MTGRNRTIVILAVVLLVLGGLSYWLTATPAAGPPATPAPPTVVVWDNTSSTPQGLAVQSITSTVALQVVNGKWRVTAPVNADADDLTVSQEASQLKTLPATLKIGDNVADLGQYGLTTPAITVTLVLSGSAQPQQQLLVGKASIDGASYYVRAAGSKSVYQVSNTLITPLQTWLDTPPVAQPTPTPLPTIAPAPTITNTGTITTTGPLSGTNPLAPTATP